jgi:hypothetical protein
MVPEVVELAVKTASFGLFRLGAPAGRIVLDIGLQLANAMD